jgi:hypothetical protein
MKHLAPFASIVATACSTSGPAHGLDARGGSDAHVDVGAPPDASPFHELPFSSGSDAPVVASVQYRCRLYVQDRYVEAQVVITDPQGPGDLTSFTDDHLGLFSTDAPAGAEREVRFRLQSDGVHWSETLPDPSDGWGVFFSHFSDQAIYNAACAALTWPADVLVVDNSGHVTTGLVHATRIDG